MNMFSFKPFFLIFPLIFLGISLVRYLLKNKTSKTDNAKNIELKIFELAEQKSGSLTVSDVVLKLGLSSSDARAKLDLLAKNDPNSVILETGPTGVISYTFIEIKESKAIGTSNR